MNEYTVTLKIANRERFVDFLDRVGPLSGAMELTVKVAEPDGIIPNRLKTQTRAYPEQVSAAAAELVLEPKKRGRGRRGPRGSKVNDTIIAQLGKGNKTAKELKQALEDADLSAGSLSTGLATLQRDNVIKRVGDGVYELLDPTLKHQAAAE